MNPNQTGSTDPASTQTSVPEQPLVPQPVAPNVADEKYATRLKIVGIVTIILGALTALSFFGSDKSAASYFLLVLSVVQVLTGFGLIKHNKIAYTIFNVLAILAILGSLILVLLGGGYIILVLMSALSENPEAAIVALLSFALILVPGAFYLLAIIWLHPKPVRQLLH